MNVDFTGRHIEITEPLRKFATDRLERLRAVTNEIIGAHFILSVEKHQRHKAEVNVKTRHGFHHGEEVSVDMYTSIAAVVDHVEKQMIRSKDRFMARTRRPKNAKLEVIKTSSVVELEEITGDTLPKVVRTNEYAAKPLSLDEAVEEVEDSDHEFLVFRNAQTERVNVVYKRKDGNIGWIDPDA